MSSKEAAHGVCTLVTSVSRPDLGTLEKTLFPFTFCVLIPNHLMSLCLFKILFFLIAPENRTFCVAVVLKENTRFVLWKNRIWCQI